MAVVGLRAAGASLVIPRVDDCISIFLGSRDAYRAQASSEPGTYYLIKGWIEVGGGPFEEHKRLIEKYGKQKADRDDSAYPKKLQTCVLHEYRPI